MPDVRGDIRDRHVGMGNSPGHRGRWTEPVNEVRLHSTVQPNRGANYMDSRSIVSDCDNILRRWGESQSYATQEDRQASET